MVNVQRLIVIIIICYWLILVPALIYFTWYNPYKAYKTAGSVSILQWGNESERWRVFHIVTRQVQGKASIWI